MQRVFIFIILFTHGVFVHSQVFREDISRLVNEVDSVLYQIYDYERIGIKNTGTRAFDSATKWLVERYELLGYRPEVDTFTAGNAKSTNLMVEHEGTDNNKWIIVGAHYDSKSPSPGANDNGSGVVATLEIARLLKKAQTRYGVRIINFGAEEQGFLGSYHYVDSSIQDSDDILFMFNLDQLGGTKGLDNSKITCERDESRNGIENNEKSSRVTDTLANIVGLYTNLTPVIGRAFSTDYIPFEEAGYVITGLYQESNDPNYHTANDVTANMDVEATTEVIKGSLAAVLHFSQVKTIVGVKTSERRKFAVSPNPASDYFTLLNTDSNFGELSIIDQRGKVIQTISLRGNPRVEVSNLINGIYFLEISDKENATKSYSKLIIAQ